MSGGKVRGSPGYIRVYGIWNAMMARCYNATHVAYHRYGGRGITVCERWHDVKNFYADMGDPPEGTTLERNDNDQIYQPNNCRWATAAEQARNRVNNVFITYNGKTLCVTDWAKIHGVTHCLISNRLKAGWPIEKALTTPPRQKRPNGLGRKPKVCGKPKERCLTYQGETHTLAEWSRITGIIKGTIWSRLKLGWSVEKALTAELVVPVPPGRWKKSPSSSKTPIDAYLNP